MNTLLNFDTPQHLATALTRSSKIHVRTHQMGKKWITTIEGLDEDLDQKRIARALKRFFQCGAVVDRGKDDIEIIKIQGNHRDAIHAWLVTNEVLGDKEAASRLVLHGA